MRCIWNAEEVVGAACVLCEIAQLYAASQHPVVEGVGSWPLTGREGLLCSGTIRRLGYSLRGILFL